ncbi:cobalamin-binding protein [Thiocapsa imhoffii]|uniref:Cobalamin-binding protein n=1 Tax=Thiocapsa imhoffii TaxID=382777 RepID=A0A9X0WKU2_9GAMM|nr:cobalamin-dependent protein [Thiocapsa imhoffii]MBK1646408.1 cobalamin-binding protein [Thiocapsa imhoffii]
MQTQDSIEVFLDALLSMDRVVARRMLVDLNPEAALIDIVEPLVVPALERIGVLWEQGEVSLSQVYMSGRICEEIIDELLPACDLRRIDQPAMAIAVLDDHHFLGKRMVCSVLRASGYELKDYGAVDGRTLVERVMRDQIRILLISTLMLPSALRVRAVKDALERMGCRPLIVVGGAPFRFDAELWREVGADAMAGTAAEGISIVRALIERLTARSD